jgi:hypothetical protein
MDTWAFWLAPLLYPVLVVLGMPGLQSALVVCVLMYAQDKIGGAARRGD